MSSNMRAKRIRRIMEEANRKLLQVLESDSSGSDSSGSDSSESDSSESDSSDSDSSDSDSDSDSSDSSDSDSCITCPKAFWTGKKGCKDGKCRKH